MPATPSAPPTANLLRLGPAALIVALGTIAYLNSFSVPFLFDDESAITDNPSIRSLWPPGPTLQPPATAAGAVGRPLVNLSLAINYALGGENPAGYHVVNLLIHLGAALALFGVVRRTLRGPALAWAPDAARTVALGAALLWAVHPLQTESVTCVIQRSESLMGLCFLLTFYAYLRAAEAPASRAWPALAVAVCAAGMASKEVMVAAPVLIFLHDRAFFGGSFAAAWRQRRRLHLGLAATWLLLAWLVAASGGDRGGTSGFAVSPTTWWQYALTQCDAITRYLALSFRPHPLVLDYGISVVGHLRDVWPQAILLLTLTAAGLFMLVRRPAWGFLAAWFFAILAPSSSVLPLATQTIAEHRMYLPLAALTTAVAILAHAGLGRRSLPVFLALAVMGTALTGRRNQDYQSALTIWADTVAKVPSNARAHAQFARALHAAGREDEAFAHYQESARLNPAAPETLYSLGLMLEERGRPVEAERYYREAIRWQADYAPARLNLGALLIAAQRFDEARTLLEDTVRLLPGQTGVHINLGIALLGLDRPAEALTPLQAAVRLAPEDPRAHRNLANALVLAGRQLEAVPHYETALRLDPDSVFARDNFAQLLLNLGRVDEAIAQLEAAQRLDPANRVRRALLDELRTGRSR